MQILRISGRGRCTCSRMMMDISGDDDDDDVFYAGRLRSTCICRAVEVAWK